MVKISVAELKLFISKAKDIKDVSSLPITKYIKLECDGDCATLTKTNLESFMVHQIEAKFNKNFVLLLEEDPFNKCVAESQGEEMKITFKDQKANNPQGVVRIVTMEDGYLVNAKFQSADEKLFPAIQSHENAQAYTLTPDMVQSLYMAAGCTSPFRGGMTYQNYINIQSLGKKKSYICGFNSTVIYYKSFDDTLPDMVLESSIGGTLAPYQGTGVIMYKGEKYDLFDTGKTLFGFVQTVLKGPDFNSIIKTKDDSKSFLVDRKSIISFCKLAIGLNPSSLVEPCFFKNGEQEKMIEFDYENSGTGKSCRIELEVKKNKRHSVQKFLFSPHDMLLLLKNLSFEKVNLVGPCSKNFFLTSDEDPDYIGAIREVAVQNEAKAVAESK